MGLFSLNKSRTGMRFLLKSLNKSETSAYYRLHEGCYLIYLIATFWGSLETIDNFRSELAMNVSFEEDADVEKR